MNDEIPYALYLKFLKPAESVRLIMSLESLDLLCLGEERIDEEFSIVHYHFKNDAFKKVVLHVEIENNASERINISLYQGASLEVIKELFLFLRNFDPDKTALIDQEIKNELFIKDQDTFKRTAARTAISNDWVHSTEKLATLPVDFDTFYNNSTAVLKRSRLFGK